MYDGLDMMIVVVLTAFISVSSALTYQVFKKSAK